jgi:hypothetical protein
VNTDNFMEYDMKKRLSLFLMTTFCAIAFPFNAWATIITSTVTADQVNPFYPPGPEKTTLVNGDFTIHDVGGVTNTGVGDGIDETTTWVFNLGADPYYRSYLADIDMGGRIAHAFLWLSLIPKGDILYTDGIQVDGLDMVGGCGECTTHYYPDLFDISSPTTVKLDLLKYYSSSDLVGVIDMTFGYVPLRFGDDSFITSSTLLVHSHSYSVPEPMSLSLLGLGLIGLASSRRSFMRS